MQANSFFIKNITVKTYDVNNVSTLKLSSIQKYMQQVAEEHMALVGLNYAYLVDIDIAFLLTHVCTKIICMPKLAEKISIKTWCSGKKGAQYYRHYQFFNSKNKLMINATSSSVPVSPKNGTILRIIDVFDESIFTDGENAAVLKKHNVKCENNAVNLRKIVYSDLDYNNHVNNSVYIDFLVDYFPLDINKCKILNYDIIYKQQARIGDELLINTSHKEDEIYYNGAVNNQTSFTALIKYKDETHEI